MEMAFRTVKKLGWLRFGLEVHNDKTAVLFHVVPSDWVRDSMLIPKNEGTARITVCSVVGIGQCLLPTFGQ